MFMDDDVCFQKLKLGTVKQVPKTVTRDVTSEKQCLKETLAEHDKMDWMESGEDEDDH